jgi:hypothetical protein
MFGVGENQRMLPTTELFSGGSNPTFSTHFLHKIKHARQFEHPTAQLIASVASFLPISSISRYPKKIFHNKHALIPDHKRKSSTSTLLTDANS